MKTINVRESISVKQEVDVLVVGGGPAGVAAGLSAARLGMKTLVVEQFNCLGGIATAGGHAHICLYSDWGSIRRVVGGIPYEIAERTVEAGYGAHDRGNLDFEIEGMKLLLERMAEEAKLEILYHTFFSDVVVENGEITAAILQNKNGRTAVAAKMVIDCTGDGDVAARAGCDYDQGEEETGLCQPMTLMFTIGGIDYERIRAFRAGDYKLRHVWQKAQNEGNMRPFQNNLMGWWWTPTSPDILGVNFTHINFVDATKTEDLTRATIEGRKQAYETIEVYRKYVPGMENCYMLSTPGTVGTRESRRIRGRQCLTRDDVLSQRRFDDSIGYGSFFIDIHNCSGPGMDKKTLRPERGFCYQIPYGIIVPEKIDNLYVAGRCASADHEALGSLRVMPQCGVMGQAAGVGAALSIRDGKIPAMMDVKELQTELRNQDCIIDDDDRGHLNEGIVWKAF